MTYVSYFIVGMGQNMKYAAYVIVGTDQKEHNIRCVYQRVQGVKNEKFALPQKRCRQLKIVINDYIYSNLKFFLKEVDPPLLIVLPKLLYLS